MSKKNFQEQTVEEKLINLYKLQTIDSKIDELHRLRGDSPLRIKDLEDELTGLKTREKKLLDEIDVLEKEINALNYKILDYKEEIQKLTKKLDNVRNNREYNALQKSIEYQEVEIQLAEKRIKTFTEKLKENKEALEETRKLIKEKEEELAETKKELLEIEKETEKEEKKLLKLRKEVVKNIEERLLKGYERIRKAMKNGLAVVPIYRNACGGCFNKIPPQRQIEVASHKKILSCEFCGRILVDDSIVEKVKEELKL